MNTKVPTIEVEVDFDLLKDYHPMLSVQHSFLIKRAVNINNVREILTYPYMQEQHFNEFISTLEYLFKDEYKLSNWKKHRDHFLYITERMISDEVINAEFKRHRTKELTQLLKTIVEVRKFERSKILPKTIRINDSLLINNHAIANQAFKFIEPELIKVYNANRFGNELPEIHNGNTNELIAFINKRNVKQANTPDIMIGFLSLALKTYLNEHTELRSMDNINIKGKQVSLKLSNSQGRLICSYLEVYKLIEPAMTPGHIRVRRYIKTYSKDTVI